MPRSYAPIVERFDVIVVGAGPAGALTAHLLARDGVSALLVDRARFPRDKPCGGGVTLRGLRLLPFAIGPVVERQITTIAFRHPDLGAFEHGGRAPVVLMTQRKRLDAFLAEQAARAGAVLRDGTRVRTVELDEGGRPAVTFEDGSRAGADVLIAADGANGTCGKSLQLGQDRIFAPALEANVAYDAVGAGVEQSTALLELGYIPGGYGWVFRRAITRMSAWAAGTRRARTCAITSAACAIGTPSPGRRSRRCAATGCRCAAPRRRSRTAGRWPSATPRASSIRSPATACTRPSRAPTWPRPARATRSTAAPATSRPIPRGSTPRSGATPRWPGSRRPRSSALPASRCASPARAHPPPLPAAHRDQPRPAHARRSAPGWRQAERLARRLLGPEAT